MNNKKLIQLLVLATVGLSCIICNLTLKTGSLSEDEARKIAERFRPILVFDLREQWWPAAIEWFRIDWSTADLENPNSYVSYDYGGPMGLNEDAPIYVSLLENDDGSLRISYAFLYAFNGCGPYLNANVNTIFGFNTKQQISVCPLGRHNGDIERITVNVGSDYKSIASLVYAYHDWTHEYTPQEVELRHGNRPIVYVAPGSHASYSLPGEQSIFSTWSFKANTFSTTGEVAENFEWAGRVWDPRIRLLKFNSQPTSDISNDEHYLAFLYPGQLGAPIANVNYDDFLKEANAYASIVESMNATAYQYIMAGIKYVTSEVEHTACPTLAGPGRDWW